MRVEAAVSQLCNLLGEQFDTVGGITEDDGLVDLEFGEQSVESVYLRLLLHEGVVLGDASKGELVHQIDFVWFVHVFV